MKTRKARTTVPADVLARYALKKGLPSSDVAGVGEELAKFLQLAVQTEESLTPSEAVDDLWHEFILDTKAYWMFCVEEYGSLVHHVPDDSEGGLAQQDAYARTVAMLREEYGSIDTAIWPVGASGARCSQCGSKCRASLSSPS